jgi:hypothetical protein
MREHLGKKEALFSPFSLIAAGDELNDFSALMFLVVFYRKEGE